MRDEDVFCQDLAGLLLREAASRRRSARPCGADIKAVALLESLAADMDRLDPAVFERCRALLQPETRSRRISDPAAALLSHVGIYACPATANDLVLWMASQLADGSRSETSAAAVKPASTGASRPVGPARRLLFNITSGLAVVLPLLAVYQAKLGVDMSRDRDAMAAHAVQTATVVASAPLDGARSSGGLSRTVIDFPLEGTGRLCRVAVTTPTASGLAAGATLAVVPRGAVCDDPLLPEAVGNPTAPFLASGLLMTAGLVCLLIWLVLVRRMPRTGSVPRSRRGPILA